MTEITIRTSLDEQDNVERMLGGVKQSAFDMQWAAEKATEGVSNMASGDPKVSDAGGLEAVRLIDEAIASGNQAVQLLRSCRQELCGDFFSAAERALILETTARQACIEDDVDPDEVVGGEPQWRYRLVKAQDVFEDAERALVRVRASMQEPEAGDEVADGED